MSDPGVPIAYTALAKGVPLLTNTGHRFGTVEHVLQIPEEDLFDGIVASTEHGLRFIDRDKISDITTTHVTCALSDAELDSLPEPNGTAVYDTDPLADSGQSLHDMFGRLFGRPHWIERH